MSKHNHASKRVRREKRAFEQKIQEPGFVRYPWLVVHQLEPDGDMITTLSGPKGAGTREFSLVLADCIQHVARAFDISTCDLMSLVENELNNPTTKISGGKTN